MASIGRQVADAFIEIHGDLAPFRKELDRAGGLIDNFGAKLKGLGGLNVLEDQFRYGIEFMQNIDRNSVKLGQMVTGVGALAGALTNMLGATAVIGQDIAALSGIGLLAPGFLTGFGIAMGVTVAALKDMGKVLGDLGPQFSALQDSISAEFWGQAEQPIRNLVDSLMPTLQTQLKATAKAMGGLFAEFADSLRGEATPERVTVMFERLNQAIDISRAAIRPFTAALVTLGEHGSKYFARFAEGIVDVSNKFNDFIQRSAQNGDLERWTEAAIQGFKDLASIVGSSVRIIGSIGDAARAAGIGGLSDMRNRLHEAADIMNSPRFQTAMTSFFRGAKAATDGVIAGIGRLGPALETAMPTIEAVFGNIGRAATRVGDILATIISNPEFLAGFQRFSAGVVQALDKLAPAAEPFARSLGGLLDLMSEVLVAVADLTAHVIQKLGPAFDRAGDQFKRLVGPLGDALKRVVDVLAPVFDAFVTNVLTPVIDIIIADVLPLATKIAEAFGPVLVTVLEEIGKLLTDVVGPAFEALNKGFDPAKANDFAKALEGVVGVFDALIASASSDVSLWEWLDSEPVRQFNDEVNQALEDFWTGIGDWINNLNETVNQGLEDFWRGMGEQFRQAAVDIINGFVNGMKETPLGQTVIAVFETIINLVKDLFGIHSPSTVFMQIGADIINGFVMGIQNLIGTVIAVAGEIVNAVMTGIQGLGAMIGAWIESLRVGWDTFWTGFGVVVQTAWTNVTTWITTAVTTVQTLIATWIATFGANWNLFWSTIGTAVQTAWTAVTTFIQTAVTTIQTGIQNFLTMVGQAWSTQWQVLVTTVQTIWTTITTAIANFVNVIRTNIDNFANTVRTNWQNFWTSVGTILQQAWTNITNAVNTGINAARNFIQTGITTIQNAWNNGWQAIQNALNNAWNAITNAVNTGINNARNFIQSGISGIQSAWQTAWNAITTFLQTAWSNISNAVNTGINNARNFVQSGLSAIQSTWSSIWSGIQSFASSVWGGIQGVISGAVGSVQGIISGALGAIQGAWSSAWSAVQSFVSSAMANIQNAVSSGISGVLNFFYSLPGQISGALGGLAGTLYNTGVQMIQGLINGVRAMAQNVINAATNVVNGAINAAKSLLGIASPSKVFAQFGEYTGEGLAIGIGRTENMVARAVEGIASTAIGVLAKSEMFTAGANAAAGLAEGLAANKDKVATALGGISVDMAATAKMGTLPGNAGTVGIPTAAQEAIRNAITIADGAIRVEAPQSDGGLVAKKVLDELVETFG